LRICGCLAVAASILLSVPLAAPAFAQGSDDTDRLSVRREDARSFRITRPESAEALVTFLSATTVRVRILALEPETSSLPEYVTTKSESSYPPVDVGVDAQRDKVAFSTSAAILNLSLEDEVLSLELRTSDKVLIDSWEIDVGERVALDRTPVRPRQQEHGDGSEQHRQPQPDEQPAAVVGDVRRRPRHREGGRCEGVGVAVEDEGEAARLASCAPALDRHASTGSAVRAERDVGQGLAAVGRSGSG